MRLRRLIALALFVATAAFAGCASPTEEEGEGAGSAVSGAGIQIDVGDETSRRDPILTMGKPNTRNMFALAVLSAAAYKGGAALHDELCEAGVQPRGTARCAGAGSHMEVELATFDTSSDDHAIYIRGTVETREGPKEVGALAFRGTASRANAITDADARKVAKWGQNAGDPAIGSKDLPGAVHLGFERAASHLWRGETPDKSLRTFLLERHGRPDSPPLYVTGHSLGGAVATITLGYMLFGECATIDGAEIFQAPRAVPAGTLAWTRSGTSCPEKSRFHVEALYTYGSPRVGDTAFAEALGNMLALRRIAHFRVVNANDIITRVAPRFTGYTHVHLNLQGLDENGRKYGLREDENADAVYGRRPSGEVRIIKCRQWSDTADNPEACPTSSLAYLLPGDPASERERTEVLRLGTGATQALDDNRTVFPSGADHRLVNYVPLLQKVLPRRSL